MPYLSLHVPTKIKDEKKAYLKQQFGELIALIPGKSEEVLMVEIADGRCMYFAGKEGNCAFLDLRLFRHAPVETLQTFTQKCIALIAEELAIPVNNVYLNIMEFEMFGCLGRLLTC